MQMKERRGGVQSTGEVVVSPRRPRTRRKPWTRHPRNHGAGIGVVASTAVYAGEGSTPPRTPF